jgi:hypothetical protein
MKDSLSRSVMAEKFGVSFVAAIPTLHKMNQHKNRLMRKKKLKSLKEIQGLW